MERLPGESSSDYHTRCYQASRVQRQLDLQNAREEAGRSGKQPFDYQSFLPAYHQIKPYPPTPEDMEMEYYLDYRNVRNLEEFIQALFETDLYDGGDMHLD